MTRDALPVEFEKIVLARHWPVDLGIAVAFAIFTVVSGRLGVRVLFAGFPESTWVLAVTVLVSSAAIFLTRTWPSVGLALLWLSVVAQVANQADAFAVQFAALYVIFAATRYGSRLALWLAGSSVFLLSGFGAFYFEWIGSWTQTVVRSRGYAPAIFGLPTELALFFLILVALTIPWLLGLIVRYATQGRNALRGQVSAEREAASAKELARLRESHAELARDVHDIVGHSLAVIIAQADSVRFIPDDEPDRIRTTIGTIAETARLSLGEVRQVLASTQGHDDQGRPLASPQAGSLDQLIEGIGASGHPVTSEVHGRPRGLSPQMEMVTFRILQEMATNAIKHGVPHAPILVARHWDPDGLRLTVRNEFARRKEGGEESPGGRGLTGVRDRLEAVGGKHRVNIEVNASGTVFYSSIAFLPIVDDPTETAP